MNKKYLKIFIVFAIIIVLVLLGVYFFMNKKETLNNNSSQDQKVIDSSWENAKERGELIVASDIPYGLMEFFNENGDPDGLDIDVIKEVASRLGLKLKIIDTDWEQLFIDVKEGKVDVAISMIAITEERKKDMLFSSPYFNGGQVIIVRKDDESIKKPEDLNDKIVGAQKGTICLGEAQKYAKPELIRVYDAYDNVIVKDLVDKKIDAIVIGYEAAVSIIKEGNSNLVKMTGDPFTQDFSGIITRLGNNSLIEEINRVFRDMKRDDTLKNIESKWMK